MDAPALRPYSDRMARSDDLDSLLGYHLRRASSLLMADLSRRLALLGLRPAEASVLVVLKDHPRITQSEIGRRLSIKRANMAPLVAGLIMQGLIERVEPVGRALPLKLSDLGHERAAAATKLMAEHDHDYFGHLDPPDHDRLRDLLKDLWRSPG